MGIENRITQWMLYLR